MGSFVLYDENAKRFAGLVGAKITIEEDKAKALVFDRLDNPIIKERFYNAVTGLNFKAVSP